MVVEPARQATWAAEPVLSPVKTKITKSREQFPVQKKTIRLPDITCTLQLHPVVP